jgi:uncharacterized membrane protein
MSSPEPQLDELRPSRIMATIRRLVRARITTGIITILPLLVTLWVIQLIFVWMRDASQWVVKAVLLAGVPPRASEPTPMLQWLGFDWERWQQLAGSGAPSAQEEFFDLMPWHVQWGISIVSVLLTLFFLYTIGLLAANLVGRRVIESLEHLVDRVPLVKTVYRGLKQILSSLSGGQTQSFRKAALVPFPQEKMRCVGFITNMFKDSVTGEELCSVFIATTPNPTTGYLQILKRKDITELNWTIEEAIRCVMSGGILKPEFLTIVPNKDLPEDLPEGVGPVTELPPPQKVDPTGSTDTPTPPPKP